MAWICSGGVGAVVGQTDEIWPYLTQVLHLTLEIRPRVEEVWTNADEEDDNLDEVASIEDGLSGFLAKPP